MARELVLAPRPSGLERIETLTALYPHDFRWPSVLKEECLEATYRLLKRRTSNGCGQVGLPPTAQLAGPPTTVTGIITRRTQRILCSTLSQIPVPSFRKNRTAARRFRRDCIRMSMTSPTSSTARQRRNTGRFFRDISTTLFGVALARPIGKTLLGRCHGAESGNLDRPQEGCETVTLSSASLASPRPF